MCSSDLSASIKAIDFAGGTVVHINAAVAGLVGAFMIGKRVGNDWITVLGEVPAPTLRQFANAVEAQPANAKP